MNILKATALAVLAALSSPALGAAAPDFSPLAGLVRQTQEATGYPFGTAVAVVKDGAIVYEGYFGYADIAARTPVTRDTVFYIASATKPFFALNALLKQEAGQFDTRMSLQQLFPDIRFAGIDAQAVTVRDLLIHASGVDNPSLVWATAFSGAHDAGSRRALVAVSEPDAKAAHGTFKYTNVGYNILSVWMDQHLAMPWQEQLDRAIFQPLAMRHTTASISKAQAAGWPLARPYSFASAQPREPLYLTKSDDTMHAAGGLVSTAPDLARFLMAQLAPGDGGALAKTVVERSHVPQIALASKYLDFPRSGYAWGWYTGTYKGKTMLHHFGGFAGFHAHLSFMPDQDIALVVLNNDDVLGAQLTNLIADYVYGVLLEEPGMEATAARRFGELPAKAAEARAAATRQRGVIQARAWNLSQPRARYAGTYRNDRLGDLTVQVGADQHMVVRWGRLTATATGAEQPEHVRVELVPNAGEFLAFTVADGEVRAAALDNIVFKKVR